MSEAKNFITKAELDAQLVDRINRALHAMCLYNGRTIVMEAAYANSASVAPTTISTTTQASTATSPSRLSVHSIRSSLLM